MAAHFGTGGFRLATRLGAPGHGGNHGETVQWRLTYVVFLSSRRGDPESQFPRALEAKSFVRALRVDSGVREIAQSVNFAVIADAPVF